MSKKYFKKTLAGIFALAIVASATPLAPFAPLLDSISITASAESDKIEVSSWSELQDAIDNASLDAIPQIVLTQDCTASASDSCISVPKSVVLDLNGFSLDRGLGGKEAVTDGCVIKNSGTLTVCDGSTAQTGKITGGNSLSSGGGIYNEGTLNIIGGSVTNNTAARYGGGIYVGQNSVLNISDGAVTGNAVSGTDKAFGGGIYICMGTVNLSGGSISENTVSGSDCTYGGGVYSDQGTIIITGGSISGHEATHGGGIYSVGSISMNGGSITGNTSSEDGGGIFNTRTIALLGGNISGNTAGKNGGGISNFGTLTITGGNISDNTAQSHGGGVFASTYGSVTVGGSAVINGNQSTNSTDAIEESNIHLQADNGAQAKLQISETTPLTNSASIGVTVYLSSGWDENTDVSKYIDGLTADNAKQFFATNCGSANKGTVYDIMEKDGSFVSTTEKPAVGNTIPNSTLTWEIDDNGVLTISGDDTAFPDCVDNSGEICVWCDEIDKVTKIVFDTPNLTAIGTAAFINFTALESVELPDTVETIGHQAFRNCKKLDTVTIPSSVTSIGINSFNGCASLKSISIPESVTSISDYTFASCSLLASVKMGSKVESIGNNSFDGCANLKSIEIPDSVTSIGNYSFRGCSALTSFKIGKGVASIGSQVFSGCIGLTSITFPDSVTSIGAQVCSGCTGLTSITFGSSVASIGMGALYKCSSLTSITFNGDMPNAINTNAFVGIGTVETPVSLFYPTDNQTWDGIEEAVHSKQWNGGYFEVTAVIKGYSVSYNGDITINFHYLVSESYKNGYVKFSDGFSDDTVVNVEDTVTDVNGYCVFPISMPAKNMYDEITAQFYDENDVAIGNAVTFDLETYMDKVKTYDPNYSDFVDSFLEYGKQAAAYFGNTNAPASTKTYDYASIISGLKADGYDVLPDMGSNYVGATMLLKSTPILRLYYKEEVNGLDLGDNEKWDTNEKNPDLTFVQKEISATNFATTFNGYSVYNYIYKAMNSNDASLKPLCAALYNMSKAIPTVG